jgi:hypothetical protein
MLLKAIIVLAAVQLVVMLIARWFLGRIDS